ncbi:MAG TPA: CheR family methyltransferase [Parvibaculum sp.]
MYEEFEKLLKQRTGLDAASTGANSVARAVQTRMSACGIADAEAYLARLLASETEFQELIDAVVVPETWFFRDREAFAALAQSARENWSFVSGRPLRLLSLPCATGEEPLSMAMTLLDAGLSKSRFHIDAIDICARSLAFAEKAVYGKNSFRGGDLGFRDRYFTNSDRGYSPLGTVSSSVRFRRGNLFDAGLRSSIGVYDVIFCRNVLIYFDAATQAEAISILKQLLAEDGLIFVGPAEAALLLGRGFVSTKVPLAFAFRKANPRDAKTPPRALAAPAMLPPYDPEPARLAPVAPAKTRATATPVTAAVAEPALSARCTEEIERLADEGKFDEALLACRRHLLDDGSSAQAHYLMGLIYDALGNVSEAVDCYRKALYLDPGHGQALSHLALHLGRGGNETTASALRERSRRLSAKGGSA